MPRDPNHVRAGGENLITRNAMLTADLRTDGISDIDLSKIDTHGGRWYRSLVRRLPGIRWRIR
jgi:hypothetical protein